MTIEEITSTLLDVINNTNTSLNTELYLDINGTQYGVESISLDRTGKEPKIRLELK